MRLPGLPMAAMPQAPGSVGLLAAGRLRGAMTDFAQEWPAASGIAIESSFGASGLLRARIVRGSKRNSCRGDGGGFGRAPL